MLRLDPYGCLVLGLLGLLCVACGDDAGSEGSASDTGDSSGLFQAPECIQDFPAITCDGDPVGTWNLVSFCARQYPGCPAGSVTVSGTVMATLTIDVDTYGLEQELDTEEHTHLPASCLDTTCDGIGCFGEETCDCINGGGTSGSSSGQPYTPSGTGRVALPGEPAIDFCAGATQADSLFDGVRRQVWERVPAG